MKFIRKAAPPRVYSNWCKKVVGTPKADYSEMPKQIKDTLLLGLLAEQGWICAYTMKRLDADNSHVEHIKPQTLCREDKPGSDLDYTNLVACFPEDGMKKEYRYGAQQKQDWWEDGGKDFISPLHPSCMTRFRFDIEGNILCVMNCRAAETTVKVLRLDHPTLTEDRGRVIFEVLFGEGRDKPLSEKQASIAIATICKRNSQGQFYEFCKAVCDALVEHIQAIRKQAKKSRFAKKVSEKMNYV